MEDPCKEEILERIKEIEKRLEEGPPTKLIVEDYHGFYVADFYFGDQWLAFSFYRTEVDGFPSNVKKHINEKFEKGDILDEEIGL